MNEVNAIVDKYGGACMECGPIWKDYVPLADLFEDEKLRLMSAPGIFSMPRPAQRRVPNCAATNQCQADSLNGIKAGRSLTGDLQVGFGCEDTYSPPSCLLERPLLNPKPST